MKKTSQSHPEEYAKFFEDHSTQHTPDDPGELWWCNTHQRRATFMWRKGFEEERHTCDPNLGGITMMCRCVNLTGIRRTSDI